MPVHAGEGVSLVGAPGAVLTLLALGGPASGITTTGLRWPLRAETLQPGSTRGVSNEIVSGPVRVELAERHPARRRIEPARARDQ